MGALGYVMQVPEEEKYLNTEKEIRRDAGWISLAGRAAEEIVFDTVTTGACQRHRTGHPYRQGDGHTVRHVRRNSA